MANIPGINSSATLYTRLKRRGQKLLETEELTNQRQVDAVPRERRHLGDRRRKNIRVQLDRRNPRDRRNKKMVKPETKQAHDIRMGRNINTTA
ncbi:MAG TPA: hypothetical protein VIQ03_08410 [Gammaproteobacteria bacterium]